MQLPERRRIVRHFMVIGSGKTINEKTRHDNETIHG
jgi:hypothetical protein